MERVPAVVVHVAIVKTMRCGSTLERFTLTDSTEPYSFPGGLALDLERVLKRTTWVLEETLWNSVPIPTVTSESHMYPSMTSRTWALPQHVVTAGQAASGLLTSSSRREIFPSFCLLFRHQSTARGKPALTVWPSWLFFFKIPRPP